MQHSTILMFPGWQDSGPKHWQSLWLKKYPNAVKVMQKDWMYPKKDEWVRGLNDAIVKHLDRDIVLVGHSLANATIAWWAKEYFSNTHAHIDGALLVSPSDVEAPDLPKEIIGFTPMPLDPLPFKSIVVASEDDPYVTMDRAKYFAQCWGGATGQHRPTRTYQCCRWLWRVARRREFIETTTH